MRVTTPKRFKRGSRQLLVALGFGFLGSSATLLAEESIGLPYTVVKANPVEDKQHQQDVEIAAETVKMAEEDFVEIAADPIIELVMTEVAPDSYGSHYRSGIDVYKAMAEHSFDDEPMLVVYAKADPAMALPEVVVIPASSDSLYTHITAAAEIIDPIARGEDKIYLRINELPENPGSSLVPKPRPKRFFSEGFDSQ